ncbi:hypothetical protein [Chromobacterium sphagni]|uniref:Uncharacterized protein n=1 Tax=Chromobacterium sphagni TaxID=1903179 RepID=A0A1S1X3F1_9NEIS|nr:hypothetical protein [Chromobacterium sphagni]OHX14011.1 hypothetical protein BI347_11205 [Chromobacterium sphagni]OHX20219.1 hypothetical protein BI344_06900 [Chromobacterium sphagni]
MSSVPQTGNYISADKNFTFKITSANPANGVITGVYQANYSPIGSFHTEGDVGHYGWVFNKGQGKDGVAPFNLSFGGSQRPDGRAYNIVDSWNGAYLTNNTILAEGSRAFVNSDGVIQVGSLGTQIFTLA